MQKLSSPKLSSPIKLIEDSVKIFVEKKNLIYFVSIYLIMIPFQIFSYFQGSASGLNVENMRLTPTTGIVTLVNVLNFIAYLLTSVAGIIAVKNVVSKSPAKFKETMVFAWKNLWVFFLLSTLVFLIIVGGAILLIVPAVIFGVWFFFAKFVFIDQGLGVKASMGKSKELVKGRFWAVLGRLIVFGLFGLLIGFTATSIPYGIGSFLLTLLGALFILPSYLLYKELA